MNAPVILITGAAKGIGLAAAKELSTRGARVIVSARDFGRAEKAADGVGATPLLLDVTNGHSISAAADAIRGTFGRIDVLVNNAAILLDHYASIETLTPDVLRETMETNVIGTLRVTQAMLPLLRESERPRVINLASGAGQLDGEPQPWAPAYSISKTAVNMLTQQLAVGLPGITVNSMCPGWCRTDMGGAEAPLTAEEGADTLVWLALDALDAPDSLNGAFVKKREVIPW